MSKTIRALVLIDTKIRVEVTLSRMFATIFKPEKSTSTV